MKNSIYPFYHWQTTLLITTFIDICWIAIIEDSFGGGMLTMFLFLWSYSFLFSIPVFGVYYGLFYLF